MWKSHSFLHDFLSAQRCICRKCRLQKCMNVGMLPEGVQNKRDPINPRICEKIEPEKYTNVMTSNPSENESVVSSFFHSHLLSYLSVLLIIH
ncbi:zinc finger, C4 type [Cooperia oncophora]